MCAEFRKELWKAVFDGVKPYYTSTERTSWESELMMKSNWRKRLAFLVMALAVGWAAEASAPSILYAQAPAGPMSGTPPKDSSAQPSAPPPEEVQPRKTILGAWKFDPQDSDDPGKKLEEAKQNGSRGGGLGGGRVSLGIPGIGGLGGPHAGSGHESDADRQKLQALLNPANSMAIAQKEAEIDVTEDESRKLELFTDGRKLQKSKDANANPEEISAHWEGQRLVTDEKDPRGGKMTRMFELSYDGRQLEETLHISEGHSPVVIRYIYLPVGPPPAAPVAAVAAPNAGPATSKP